jgi:hypothetical protein
MEINTPPGKSSIECIHLSCVLQTLLNLRLLCLCLPNSFTHIACFSLPRKVGKITVQEFVEDHLEDETPNLVLSDETKRQEIIDAIASKKGGRKSTGEGEGDDTAVSRKIAEIKAAMANEEEGEEKPSKKAKGDSKLKEEVDAMKIYGKMPNAELKDVLRWNLGYGMTGKKDELLLR